MKIALEFKKFALRGIYEPDRIYLSLSGPV